MIVKSRIRKKYYIAYPFPQFFGQQSKSTYFVFANAPNYCIIFFCGVVFQKGKRPQKMNKAAFWRKMW